MNSASSSKYTFNINGKDEEMESTKRKAPVLEHQGLKSKHCKNDDSTHGHTNSRAPNDWIRSSIDELKKIIGKKGMDETTVLCLRLVINFLEVASKALGGRK